MTEDDACSPTGSNSARDIPSDVARDALWTAARQAAAQSDWSSAVRLLEEASPLFREDGTQTTRSFTLSELGFRRPPTSRARPAAVARRGVAVDAVAPRRSHRSASAADGAARGRSAHRRDYTTGARMHRGSVALRRELGDPLLVTDAVYNLGWVAFSRRARLRTLPNRIRRSPRRAPVRSATRSTPPRR